jgi:hypothetical protein
MVAPLERREHPNLDLRAWLSKGRDAGHKECDEANLFFVQYRCRAYVTKGIEIDGDHAVRGRIDQLKPAAWSWSAGSPQKNLTPNWWLQFLKLELGGTYAEGREGPSLVMFGA